MGIIKSSSAAGENKSLIVVGDSKSSIAKDEKSLETVGDLTTSVGM